MTHNPTSPATRPTSPGHSHFHHSADNTVTSLKWTRVLMLAVIFATSIQKAVSGQITSQLVYRLAAQEIWLGLPIYRVENRLIDPAHLPLDLFAYSPAFALWFSVLSPLPAAICAIVWNLASAAFLLYATHAFCRAFAVSKRQEVLGLIVASPAIVLSAQHFQVNIFLLSAAMYSLAAAITPGDAARRRFPFAAVTLAAAASMKPYILIVAPLLVFISPERRRERAWLVAATLAWTFAFPFIALEHSYAVSLYRDWGGQMLAQSQQRTGESVMALFGWIANGAVPNPGVQLTWLVVTAASGFALVRSSYSTRPGTNAWQQLSRWHFYALMTGVVIFNHKSEGPTLVIAVLPAALWLAELWFTRSKNSFWWAAGALVVLYQGLALVMFEGSMKDYAVNSGLRIIPLVLAWAAITFAMVRKTAVSKKALQE